MFSKLNDLTLTTLVYELFELRTFKKGQIVMQQSKQAPTNIDYKQFYSKQISKMAMKIKKRKTGGAGGGTANQSTLLEGSLNGGTFEEAALRKIANEEAKAVNLLLK
jgi:hypothetical protein